MARIKSVLGLSAVATAALTALSMGSAYADYAPAAGDVIGVGSDTVQNMGNFLADGDNIGGIGYNAAGNKFKMVSFDATPDANDRAGYLNGSTSAALKPLTPTIVLRSGLQPVQRPNGSGAGIGALLADTTHKIDFVRMSRLPSVAEQNTAIGTSGVGSLRVIKIATDYLQIATAATTNSPAALTASQLVDIYLCKTTADQWSEVGGTSTNKIIPIVPQSGSGTRSTFLADLQAANGGTAVTPGSCVVTAEENDPSAITGAIAVGETTPRPADAIAPFSAGRKALYDSTQYFNDPTKTFAQTPVTLSSGIALLGGATPTSATYNNNRNLYIVFRDSDVNSATPFQPGGTKNWVRDLFYNPGSSVKPYVQSDNGQADIADGGGVPLYANCGAGNTVTSC